MKVLHICNGAQGYSPFYKHLFQALKRKEVKQSLLVPVWKTPNIDFEDIECEYFYRDSGILARLRFLRKIKKLTTFALEKFDVTKYDVIHAHTWFSDGAVAYNLHKKYGIPYIVAVRNTDINIFYKYFIHLRKLGHSILENAYQIIFIAPAYKNYVINELLPQKIINEITDKLSVIPNGVSSFWLNQKQQKTKLLHPVRILSAGAITPNKNHLALCRVIESLRKRGVEIELTIVGKGYKDAPRYLKKLENYIKNKPHITLVEKQNQEELLQTFRNHNIFVLPSHTETFGLVYIEALTQGLPIVYTKDQGIDGYFKYGEIGYAVNPKNTEEISQAIVSIISKHKTLSDNITQLDFSIFDWEKIAERYLEIYCSC